MFHFPFHVDVGGLLGFYREIIGVRHVYKTLCCIYGDPAYPLRVQLQAPFKKKNQLTPIQQEYNKAMSNVRISVEWVFGENSKTILHSWILRRI